MKLKDLEIRDLPPAPSLKKLLGPSFIMLGLGLGSGELVLWPFLTSKYGMGIIWGAILGITFQFFLNMEIERYALVTGESVFVGMARKLRLFAPIWFIASTFIPWIWPGIIASSGALFASAIKLNYSPLIPSLLLILIGIILTLGPVVYKTQEIFQKVLITISVPTILAILIYFIRPPHLSSLLQGLMGRGEGFMFLPIGVSLGTFLGAFAYSGAGGNLNLSQSYYIKEKGYGMGKYSGRITSILTGKAEKIRLTGQTFALTPANLKLFKTWWKRINLEHFLVFWLMGSVTMLSLATLSYIILFDQFETANNIGFLIHEAFLIGQKTLPFIGTFFLFIGGLMLFSTQFSVFDSTSRIMSENLIILSNKFKIEKLRIFYYMFLWAQILAGLIIFSLGIAEPLQLVIIGAVLNAISMFIYSIIILIVNITLLDKSLRPSLIRRLILIFGFLFYGILSSFTILSYIKV
jgi:hypothetical protein